MTDLSGMVEVAWPVVRNLCVPAPFWYDEMEWKARTRGILTALTPHIEKLVEEARGGRVTVAEGELLPCPFCGGRTWLYEHRPLPGLPTISTETDHDGDCPLASTAPFIPMRTTEAEAITAWNTRAHSIAPVDDALSTEAPVSLKTDGDVQLPLKVDDADVRAALEPFAAVAREYHESDDDWHEVWMDAGPEKVIRGSFRLEHYRRAANLLSRLSASGVGRIRQGETTTTSGDHIVESDYG